MSLLTMIELIIIFTLAFGEKTDKTKNIKRENITNLRKLRDIDYDLDFIYGTCYDKKISDDLLLVENIKMIENSIFFIETSCNGGLDMRQACSVESAAKAHPHKQINVLFLSPISKTDLKAKTMRALLRYPNIQLLRILFNEYVKGSPLETAAHSLFNHSVHFIYHLSDVLRYLTLYKFGGIYLDLDVIVVKPLDSLPQPKNWVGIESHVRGDIGSGLIAVYSDKTGRAFIKDIVKIFKDKYDPYSWKQNGPGVLQEAVENICGPDVKRKLQNNTSFTCKGTIDFHYHHGPHTSIADD